MWGMSEGISFGCANVPIHHAKFLRKYKKQNLSCKIGEGILKHLLKSVTGEGRLWLYTLWENLALTAWRQAWMSQFNVCTCSNISMLC